MERHIDREKTEREREKKRETTVLSPCTIEEHKLSLLIT